MQRRQHGRVRLRLPVRVRWTAPFGQRTELCETTDVSRSGLLLSCQQPHALGAALWVTLPYDGSLPDGQLEVAARVVRCVELLSRSAVSGSTPVNAPMAVAICYEPKLHALHNGNGHKALLERRSSARHSISVPVRVRPEHIPWFEETMTLDVSTEGLRFVSNREYPPADPLLISFEGYGSSPWPISGEVRARIVRVEPMTNGNALAITVQRLS